MWYLSQLGRREHYALPAYLHAQGKLRMLATDVWAPWAQLVPSMLCPHKLSQRFSPEMACAHVVSPSLAAGILGRFRRESSYARWVREGMKFGSFAARQFARNGLGAGDAVLGYTAANLEQLRCARKNNARGLHVQVDPGVSWYRVRESEQIMHPYAEPSSTMPSGEFLDRIAEEWDSADVIIVHSKHTMECLIDQGVPASKCRIIPPAFKPKGGSLVRTCDPGKSFKVLFVGNHCLAKGFHVFAEAAKLAGSGFEFRSAGSEALLKGYRAEVARYVTILGRLPHAHVLAEMRQADVLVFPTLSDGFGLVQLEAMAMGLPVVSTSCCGEVVRNGIDGYVIPERDPVAIVQAIELLKDPERHRAFSAAALLRSDDFSPERQAIALMDL